MQLNKLNIFYYTCCTIILLSTAVSYTYYVKNIQLFDIPKQTTNLLNVLGDSSKDQTQTIEAFQISEFITYKEYNNYLTAIKEDSSLNFYMSQLPDSTIATFDVINTYRNNEIYDNEPILGISWDNAMNYCKWKTLNDNKKAITFIYRLPTCYEWLAAYSYLSGKGENHDFNNNYADWLLDSKANNNIPDKNGFPFNFFYFHEQTDQEALKRKFVIGNSYFFQQEKLIDYYNFNYIAFIGYKHISFRYVKESVSESNKILPGQKSIAAGVLEYWGLTSK